MILLFGTYSVEFLNMYFTRKFRSPQNPGFTLVELLVVISIITIVGFLVQPAIASLFKSENFTGNVAQVNSLIKQARAQAIAQNTFVWLGFYPTTTNGSSTVVATAVAGKSGLSTDLANGYYQPVMRPLFLKNLQIVSTGTLTLTGFDVADNTDISQSVAANSFSQSVTGTSVTFTNVIVFSPDGEATLNTTQTYKCIGIGLKPGATSTTGQVAAIQVSGLLGQPSLYRQ